MQSETALCFFNLRPHSNVEILLLFGDFVRIEHPFALRYYRGGNKSVVAQIVLGLNPSVCFRGAEMEKKNKPLVFIYIHLNRAAQPSAGLFSWVFLLQLHAFICACLVTAWCPDKPWVSEGQMAACFHIG